MFTSSSSTLNTIDLTWNTSGSPDEMGYFISFKRTDITSDLTPQWIFVNRSTASQTLSGLLGGTNYNITLRLVEGSSVSPEVFITATTSEGGKCVVWWLGVCLEPVLESDAYATAVCRCFV